MKNNNTIPTPKVGDEYKLSWSSNRSAKYKLLSWSNDGHCIMRSSSGKEFHTHLNHLRSIN